MIEIREVNLDSKKEIKKFIKFEWEVYKNDKNWVPPLIIDMLTRFNPKKNPFFEHSEVQPYLAYENCKIVGRIVAIVNHLHNQFHNEKVVFFGFFEVLNNFEIAKSLFDKVAEYGREKGMNIMRGPTSFSSNDMWGLLIENFDEPPVVMMPYNPPYYIQLIEKYGFKKAKDLLAYKLDAKSVKLPERVKNMVEYLEKREDIKIRSVNFKDFKNEVKILKEIYNYAWEKNWGFVPMTDKEFEHTAKDLKTISIPEMALVAEVKGEPVGLSVCIPDANFATKRANGRLFPFGLFKILYYFKKIKFGRLLILGVKKDFCKRGLEALFYAKTLEAGIKLGWEGAELSWILEDNELIKRGIELMGGKVYKKYRIYEKEI